MMRFEDCKAGQRVRIKHTIDRREQDWHTAIEGVIEGTELQKTGSWYAHSKDNKFWLRRIRIRKDDGELTLISVDPGTQIELLDAGAQA